MAHPNEKFARGSYDRFIRGGIGAVIHLFDDSFVCHMGGHHNRFSGDWPGKKGEKTTTTATTVASAAKYRARLNESRRTSSRTSKLRRGRPLSALMLCVVMTLLAAGPASAIQSSAQSAAAPGEGEFEDGKLLVGFHAGSTQGQREEAVRAAGATVEKVIGRELQTHVLKVAKGGVHNAVQRLRSNPKVRYAEPNYRYAPSERIPNDTYFSSEWGLKNTGQSVNNSSGTADADADISDAWDGTRGSDDVVVAVIDTGVDYTHPDFTRADGKTNLWVNPGGIGGCPAGTYGYNSAYDHCDPRDDHYYKGEHSHGTHVAGTIGAAGNNGRGIAGVAWATKVMTLKHAAYHGYAYSDDSIEAIYFAVTAKRQGVNVRVLNASWGGKERSQGLFDWIDWAGRNDILFVAAAGNENNNNDETPRYPCNFGAEGASNVICVAASDQNDNRASFSNYGKASVDLFAPGVNIFSTIRTDLEVGHYAYFAGTSMAAPHVTGTAALVLAGCDLDTAKLKATIKKVDVKSQLQADVSSGGRLNTQTALFSVCSPQGRQWKFDGPNWVPASDSGTDLTSVRGLADPGGPCAGKAPQSCLLDTRHFWLSNGKVYDAVTAYGKYWHIDTSTGSMYSDFHQDIPRWEHGPCAGKPPGQCRFDTYTVAPLNGRRIESITAYGRYWNFDITEWPAVPWPGNGSDLTSVPRYANGPCAGRAPGTCVFDTRLVALLDGTLVESITAYGRYWNFYGPDWTPAPDNGRDLTSVARYARGPCALKDPGACRFTTRAIVQINGKWVEVITT